jgi:hypothetical protein
MAMRGDRLSGGHLYSPDLDEVNGKLGAYKIIWASQGVVPLFIILGFL